jgi:hypothetical protein
VAGDPPCHLQSSSVFYVVCDASSRCTRLRSPNGCSRALVRPSHGHPRKANPNAARASWRWIWQSVSPQGLPAYAALLSSAPDPCSCFPPEAPWLWCVGAWRGSARQPASASSLCQSRLSPPRRFGWTHLRTGSALSNTVQARQPRFAHSRSSDPAASGGRERCLTDCRTPVLLAPTPTNFLGRGLSRPPRQKRCQLHSARPSPAWLK